MIICEGEQFERAALRENEFEAVVRNNWEQVHADSRIFEWRPLVKGSFGSCRPDAIVIFNDLRSWAVIEFELASHATSHFDGQFAALESADWARADVAELMKNFELHEVPRISRLLRLEPPRLLCISDDFGVGLGNACRENSFEHMVITPYLARTSAKFALKLEKRPASFKSADKFTNRSFQMFSDLKFIAGRISVTLPTNFPNFEEIRIVHNDVVQVNRVFRQSESRRILLDPVIVDSRNVFDMVEIDPNLGVFKVL